VRRAKAGETTTTLDGKQRLFTTNTLLITDPSRAVGIAGIMGGENSEITPNTKTVLFESAKFAGANIRVSAKALGLTTEASQRFAKGIDIEGVPHALNRAMQLVAELGAGEVEQGDD
jgi:phenylalanyl-tRNA synthetase beta chain